MWNRAFVKHQQKVGSILADRTMLYQEKDVYPGRSRQLMEPINFLRRIWLKPEISAVTLLARPLDHGVTPQLEFKNGVISNLVVRKFFLFNAPC